VSQELGTTKSPPGDRAPISGIVRRLVEVYRPERVCLVGSAARGDPGPDSDYGFMAVVSGDTPRETRETKAVFKALLSVDLPIDVLVRTRREFDRRLHLRVSFPSTIVREGRLLYAA
jgi:predicted nucleotidyltransferase